MVPVYDAAHATDAYLVKHLLEAAAIPCHVRGEHLQGAIGGLPAQGLLSVCVAEGDARRARAIVVDWMDATPDPETVGSDTP